jgi:hypothetical protein
LGIDGIHINIVLTETLVIWLAIAVEIFHVDQIDATIRARLVDETIAYGVFIKADILTARFHIWHIATNSLEIFRAISSKQVGTKEGLRSVAAKLGTFQRGIVQALVPEKDQAQVNGGGK